LEKIHAPDVAFFVKAERTFLALAEGGCNVPLGAWAEATTDGQIRLHAFVGRKGWQMGQDVDVERVSVVGPDPAALAWTAIQIIQDRRNGSIWGGDSQAEALAGGNGTARILVTASESVGRGQMRALQAAGFGVVHVPMIETESVVSLEVLQEVASGLKDGDWLVFSSSAAVRYFLERLSRVMLPEHLRVAVVGEHTAQSVRAFGVTVEFVPTPASADGFVAQFGPCQSRKNPARFVLPVAMEGRRAIAKALRSQGHEVLPVYRTKAADGEAAEVALSIEYEAVVFSSPSGVKSFQSIRGGLPPVCVAIGSTTHAALKDAGAPSIWLAEDPSPESIVSLLQSKLGTALTEIP
jgi:uroporphyrinogen-III synthase